MGGTSGCAVPGDDVAGSGVKVMDGPIWASGGPAPNAKTDLDYIDVAAEKVNVVNQIHDILYIGYEKCGGTGTWQAMLYLDDGDGIPPSLRGQKASPHARREHLDRCDDQQDPRETGEGDRAIAIAVPEAGQCVEDRNIPQQGCSDVQQHRAEIQDNQPAELGPAPAYGPAHEHQTTDEELRKSVDRPVRDIPPDLADNPELDWPTAHRELRIVAADPEHRHGQKKKREPNSRKPSEGQV